MARRLISYDALTCIGTYHEYDSATDETHIIHLGDSEPYLEENKRLVNNEQFSKDGIAQGFWKYASIPPAVQVKWLIEKGVDVYNNDHGKEVLKLVNDPEYKYLKTTAGHHWK